VPIVIKYGSLNLLEHSGPLNTCNGIALTLPLIASAAAAVAVVVVVVLSPALQPSTGYGLLVHEIS
jgi:hypothetical protein